MFCSILVSVCWSNLLFLWLCFAFHVLGLLWNTGILQKPYKNFTWISLLSKKNARNRKKKSAFQRGAWACVMVNVFLGSIHVTGYQNCETCYLSGICQATHLRLWRELWSNTGICRPRAHSLWNIRTSVELDPETRNSESEALSSLIHIVEFNL